MNIVMVLVDSLTRNALSAYHPSDIDTPNIDTFAEKSVRFDNHFVGSLPCMPARREIFSGRKEMMWRPWGPLEPFDARLPDLFRGARLPHSAGDRSLPLLGRSRERLPAEL